MNKKEAIQFLRESLGAIPHLATLRYDNQDYPLWRSNIKNVLENAFGESSKEYKEFASSGHLAHLSLPGMPDEVHQDDYARNLQTLNTEILKILKKYEILGIEEKLRVITTEPPKAFIAHGGDSPALRNLKSFLEALGMQPLVVEEQPSEGRSVSENVDWYARQADCAIILATKGDIDGKTGSFIPRGNVLMEIGKLQQIFKDRIIYLLQAGAKFPTNISEKVRGRFTTQSMDKAFIKIAKELKKFGILKAIKP